MLQNTKFILLEFSGKGANETCDTHALHDIRLDIIGTFLNN